LATKFDVGAPRRPFDGAELPWAYGEDRITATARDPDSLYVYWEITDGGIAGARRRLGTGGEVAWCNLRLYETTGRDFDGTNANDYFDIGVGREDRERFVMIHRPGASFHAEIGMMSKDGYFQPIARSGRAECPRASPGSNQGLEWMTVTTHAAHPTARPYISKFSGPAPLSYAPAPGVSSDEQPPSYGTRASAVTHEQWSESQTWTWAHPSTIDVRWEGPWLFGEWHAEWRTHWLGMGSTETTTWRVGPFPLDVGDGRIEVRFVGGVPASLRDEVSGLEIFGPWQITIRSFDVEPHHRVLGTWNVHWVTVSPPYVQRWLTALERRSTHTFRREVLTGFASGAQALVEIGASEMWRIGGSERRWIGASERWALGGTEVLWLGASQLLFGGASALLARGASEVRWGGASERLWPGASEAWSAAFGASESWLTASQHPSKGRF
jgi:hypothetical protein